MYTARLATGRLNGVTNTAVQCDGHTACIQTSCQYTGRGVDETGVNGCSSWWCSNDRCDITSTANCRGIGRHERSDACAKGLMYANK